MGKKIVLVISLLLCFGIFWYFFLKSYDYSISFQASTVPGTAYQKVLNWDGESTESMNTAPLKEMFEEKTIAGTPIELKWEFISQSDTTTLVRANVKTIDNNLKERWLLLFGKTELQSEIEEEVRALKESLEGNLEMYSVSLQGEAMSPESFCVCIALDNKVTGKASDMMRNINTLAAYIKENQLEMPAKPRIQITEWNHRTNRIKYDFCFPVSRTLKLPEHPEIFSKSIPSQRALKAIFKGHYGISHLAWYSLLNYAERRDIEVVYSPLEVFNVNPELGGDSRYWEAEIYLPIKRTEGNKTKEM